MKILWYSDDERNVVIKFNKNEISTINRIVQSDESFIKSFEVDNIEKNKYLFSKKDKFNIIECVEFLKISLLKNLV